MSRMSSEARQELIAGVAEKRPRPCCRPWCRHSSITANALDPAVRKRLPVGERGRRSTAGCVLG